MRLRYFALLLFPLVLPLIAACGPSRPDTAPVNGNVTLDGKPIAGAQVMLVPTQGGRPGQGLTDEQGNFTIGTFEKDDGALLGPHNITVTSKRRVGGSIATADGLEGPPGQQRPKIIWLTPQKYSRQETSGFSVEVKQGMEPLKLQLVSQ